MNKFEHLATNMREAVENPGKHPEVFPQEKKKKTELVKKAGGWLAEHEERQDNDSRAFKKAA